MIEVVTYWDFLPNIDMEEYQKWAKNAIETILSSKGVVEFSASRNIGGSPQVRSTAVWKTLADWANYAESPESQAIDAELRHKYATNVNIVIWRSSPIVPKPLKAKRNRLMNIEYPKHKEVSHAKIQHEF